jgi:tRNA nucleotidyltransferase/poly(A) polymerase
VNRVIEFVRAQGGPAWLVGGYVRDRLLGRPTHDLDLIVPSDAVRLARRLGDAFGGASFVLDAQRDVGRVILADATGQALAVDVARLRVPELLDDLALRDFTVNAMALDIASPAMPLVDPFDGRADLDRRLLRAVTEGAFHDDPLRMLRGVRLVAELGLAIDGATFNLIRRDARLLPAVSPERIRDELMRIVASPLGWQHLRLLADLGLLQVALPESAAQSGVAQSPPHYQDVFDHSRSVLAHLQGIFSLIWPDGPHARPQAAPGCATVIAGEDRWREIELTLAPYVADLQQHLAQPLAAGRTRKDALCWAALAHDWGKPLTRTVEAPLVEAPLVEAPHAEAPHAEAPPVEAPPVEASPVEAPPGGRIRFFDHAHRGAQLVEGRLQALRFSGDEIEYVARLTALHMRPGELANQESLTRRAEYHFFRDAGSYGPDVALLSLADYLATLAPTLAGTEPHEPEASRWRKRLETARHLLEVYFRERETRVSPAPLLDGRQVMSELGLPPGPAVGVLLEGLAEAQAVGLVRTRDEAVAWLREQPVAGQRS